MSLGQTSHIIEGPMVQYTPQLLLSRREDALGPSFLVLWQETKGQTKERNATHEIWMTKAELETLCPMLLHTSALTSSEGLDDITSGLLADVRRLVVRLRSQELGPRSITTLQVLLMYGKMSQLIHVFQEKSTLDFLFTLVEHHNAEVKQLGLEILQAVSDKHPLLQAEIMLKLMQRLCAVGSIPSFEDRMFVFKMLEDQTTSNKEDEKEHDKGKVAIDTERLYELFREVLEAMSVIDSFDPANPDPKHCMLLGRMCKNIYIERGQKELCAINETSLVTFPLPVCRWPAVGASSVADPVVETSETKKLVVSGQVRLKEVHNYSAPPGSIGVIDEAQTDNVRVTWDDTGIQEWVSPAYLDALDMWQHWEEPPKNASVRDVRVNYELSGSDSKGAAGLRVRDLMDLAVIISDMSDNLCRLVDVELEPLLSACGLTSSKDLPEVLQTLSDADVFDLAEVLWRLRNETRSFKEHLECSTKRNAFFSGCQPAPSTATPADQEEVEEFNYPRRKQFASTAAYAKANRLRVKEGDFVRLLDGQHTLKTGDIGVVQNVYNQANILKLDPRGSYNNRNGESYEIHAFEIVCTRITRDSFVSSIMTMYSEYHTTPTLSELDLEFVSSLDRSHSRLSHVVDALQTAVAKGAGVNAVYSALRVLWQYTPTVDITGIALFDSVVNFFQQYPLFLQDAEVLVALTGWLTALVNHKSNPLSASICLPFALRILAVFRGCKMHSCYQTVVRSVSILLINLFGGFSSEADNVSAVAMLDDQARLAKELLKLACMQPPQQIEGMKSTFWDSHVQQPQWVNLIELLRVMLEADLSLTCFGLLHVIRQLVSSQRLQAQAAADAGLLGVAAQIARKEGRPALVANKVITAVRSFGLGDEEQMFANVARYQEQLDYLNNLVSCLSDSPSIISDLQALENAITLLTNGVTERHTSVEDFLRTSKFLSTFEHILLRRCGTGGLVSETSNFTTAQLIINILLVLVSELSADTRTQNWRGVVVGVECVLSRLDTVTSDEDVGSSTHELIIDIARFFNVLCTFEPDIAVLCASLSVKTYLYDKLGSNMRNETCRNLLDSIEKASCHVTCAQKVTKLYWSNVHRVLQKVYMCCMQSSSVPPIPFFDYLCLSVSGVDGATISGEVDGNDLVLEASTQCFPHVVENLTTDESTYWQSQGSAGTHWVSISTKSGKKRIKAVTLHAWSQGDSYVPERLAVYGGETTRMCTHELVSVQRASYHPQKGCKIDFQWSQYPCIRICVLGNVSSGCDCQLKQIAVETSSISDHLTILDPNLTFRMTARTLFHLRQAEALLTDQKCSVVQALHSFVSAIDRLLAAEQSALRSLEVVCKRSCWALLLGLFASVENYLKKETGATFFRRVFSLYFQPNDLLDEDKAAFAGSLDRFLILLSANSTSTSTVASTMKGVLYTAIDPVVQAVFAAAEARPADLPTGLMDLLGHVDHLARVNFHPDFARLKKAFFDGFLRLSDVASITAAHTLMNTLHEAVTTQDFAEAIIHSVTTVILLSEGTLFGSTCFGLHKALMAHRLASRGLLSLSKSELYLDVLLNRGDGCAAEIHTASTDVQDVHNHFSSVFQRRSSPDFDVLLLAHAYQLPVTPLPLPAIFRERVTECLESYSPHAAAYFASRQQKGRLQWTGLGRATIDVVGQDVTMSTLQASVLMLLDSDASPAVTTIPHIAAELECPLVVVELAVDGLLDVGLLERSTDVYSDEEVVIVNRRLASWTGPSELPISPAPQLDKRRSLAHLIETRKTLVASTVTRLVKSAGTITEACLVYETIETLKPRGTGTAFHFRVKHQDVQITIGTLVDRRVLFRHAKVPSVLCFDEDAASGFLMSSAAHLCAPEVISRPPADFLQSFLAVSDLNLFSYRLPSIDRDSYLETIESSVKELMEVLHVSEGEAFQRCIIHKWRPDILEVCLDQHVEYTDDTSTGECTPQTTAKSTQCHICFDSDVPVESLDCGHTYCASCWSSFFVSKIREGKLFAVTCPHHTCGMRPDPSFVRSHLDESTLGRYGTLVLRNVAECRSNLTFCANPNECGYVVQRVTAGFESPCSACGWRSCFSCSFPQDHSPAPCGAVSQWIDDGGYHFAMSDDQLSLNTIKMRTKRCPECQILIQKNEGCQHMSCPRCSYEFCWRCLGNWNDHNAETCTSPATKGDSERSFQSWSFSKKQLFGTSSWLTKLEAFVLRDEVVHPPSITLLELFFRQGIRLHQRLGYSCIVKNAFPKAKFPTLVEYSDVIVAVARRIESWTSTKGAEALPGGLKARIIATLKRMHYLEQEIDCERALLC